MEYIFEFATRNKVRFPYRGQVTVEDLWDLNMKQLNEVFQNIQAQHEDNVESLISEESEEDVLLGVQADIVRHIFNVKKVEAEAKEQEAAKREKKRRLQGLLARKEEAALEDLTPDEIQEMIKSL
jgi:ABC-type oligopeptide transport system ATPase subunit